MKDKESFYSSGSYGCVFYPKVNCTSKNIKNKNMISKVSLLDFYSKNEYNISNIIKSIKINNDNTPFIYVEQKCLLKKKQISNLNKKFDCAIFKKKRKIKKYVIFYLKYIKSDEVSNYFSENFSLTNFFNFYIFVLKYINILNINNIIHKDLHFGNVLIDNNNDFHIIDFGLSII